MFRGLGHSDIGAFLEQLGIMNSVVNTVTERNIANKPYKSQECQLEIGDKSTSTTETTCMEFYRASAVRGASWVLLRQMPPDNVPLAIPKNGMVRLNHRARHQLQVRLALWRRESRLLPECQDGPKSRLTEPLCATREPPADSRSGPLCKLQGCQPQPARLPAYIRTGPQVRLHISSPGEIYDYPISTQR